MICLWLEVSNCHSALKSVVRVSFLFVWVFVGLVALSGKANAGVTVITHGFQLTASVVEQTCWPLRMGVRISERIDGGRSILHRKVPVVIVGGRTEDAKYQIVRKIKEDSGGDCALKYFKTEIKSNELSKFEAASKFIQSFKEDLNDVVKGSAIEQDVIIVFDWADQSNTNAKGYSEAAGDALSAYLLAGAKEKMWDLKELHFIGHSRGTVVNSEAIQRLLYLAGDKSKLLPDGVEIDKSIRMTTLDPHPVGNWVGVVEATNDNHVNQFNHLVDCGSRILPSKRCGVVGWKYGSTYAVSQIDNYFRIKTNALVPGFVIGLNSYEGLESPVELINLDVSFCGGHSATWDYYMDTINSFKGKSCSVLGFEVNFGEFGYNFLKHPSPALNEKIFAVLMDVKEDKEFAYARKGADQNFLFNGDFPKSGNAAGWEMFGGNSIAKNIEKDRVSLLATDIKSFRSENIIGHSITYIPKFKARILFDLFNVGVFSGSNVGEQNKKTKLEIYLVPVEKTQVEVLTNPGSVVGAEIKIDTVDLNTSKSDKETISVDVPKEFWGHSSFLAFKLVTTGLDARTVEKVDIANVRIVGTVLDDGEAERPISQYDSELAIVLDRSGSMAETSKENGKIKMEKAKEAIASVVPVDDSKLGVSLSVFSDSAATIQKMTSVDSFQASMQQTLNQIQPGGGTNIGSGLSLAYQELDKTSSTAEGSKVAELLSDGQNNRGEWKSIVQQFDAKDWPIYTIPFGRDADHATLREIARQTGGIFDDADTSNLTAVIQRHMNHSHKRSDLLIVSDNLPPEGQAIYPFNVNPDSQDLKIQSSWLGSQLRAQVITPGGSQYTNADIEQLGGHYYEGDTFQSITIPNPASGNWSLQVDWSEPPEEAEQININITGKTDLAASIFGLKPSYQLNETVNILIDIDDVSSGKRVSINDASIVAEIQKPEEKIIRLLHAKTSSWEVYREVERDITRAIEMFDDGQHGDFDANDGIYGGYFQETNLNGPYAVSLNISGVMQNGADFSRQIHASFQVGDIRNNMISNSHWLNAKHNNWNDNTDFLDEAIFSEPLDTLDKLMDGQSDALDSLLQ